MSKKKDMISQEELFKEAMVPEEEQPYQLPYNWVWVNTGFCIDIERGITFPASAKNYSPEIGLIGCARTSNIQEEFIWDDMIYVETEYYKSNPNKLVKKDDILMSSANSYHLVGKVSYIHELIEEITFGGFLLCIRAKKVNSKYLYYFLRNQFYSGVFQKMSSQTTNIANINASKIETLPFPLPPKNEQKRIADKVEWLLDKINQAKQLIEEAKETFELRRAAILDKAFRGELTKKWRVENLIIENAAKLVDRINPSISNEIDDKPFELPDTWKWCRVGDLFHVQVGSTPSRQDDEFWDGTLPWISSGEVAFKPIVEAREKVTTVAVEKARLKLVPKGSVLFGMIGEGKTRGQVAVLEIDSYHNQNVASIWVSQTEVDSYYVYYWLLSQYTKNRQKSSGNNQPAYNKARVQDLIIPIAPITEQFEILYLIKKLIVIEDEINEKLDLLHRLEEIKRVVLQKAFMGELGTNNSKEEIPQFI